MADRNTIFGAVKNSVPPVHSEGHLFIAVGAIATVLAFFLSGVLALICAIATAYLVFFFRNPDRVTPLRDGLVVAASDGIIESIDMVRPPMELGLGTDERCRIATHLSLMDVHINRAPVAGRVARSVYVPGAFTPIGGDKDNEDNERRIIVLETQAKEEIAVVLIAGLVTRRIVTFAYEGDNLGVGERIGLIRFGSRVDVYLPKGKRPLVAVGQRMVAGETVIADLKSDEPEREARRS